MICLGGTLSWTRLLGSVGYQGLPKKGFPPSIELIRGQIGEVIKGAEEKPCPARDIAIRGIGIAEHKEGSRMNIQDELHPKFRSPTIKV